MGGLNIVFSPDGKLDGNQVALEVYESSEVIANEEMATNKQILEHSVAAIMNYETKAEHIALVPRFSLTLARTGRTVVGGRDGSSPSR